MDNVTDAQDPVTTAALALLKAAREHALVLADPTTVAQARIICRASGFDPDMVVMGVPGAEPIKGPKGTIGIYAPMSPAWALYWDDAMAAMAAENPVQEVGDARQDSTV